MSTKAGKRCLGTEQTLCIVVLAERPREKWLRQLFPRHWSRKYFRFWNHKEGKYAQRSSHPQDMLTEVPKQGAPRLLPFLRPEESE